MILHPVSPSAVQRQAKAALTKARLAADAYGEGVFNRAESLHATAERTYVAILAAICELTDEGADEIEPTVTELERVLYRLACIGLGTDPLRLRLN